MISNYELIVPVRDTSIPWITPCGLWVIEETRTTPYWSSHGRDHGFVWLWRSSNASDKSPYTQRRFKGWLGFLWLDLCLPGIRGLAFLPLPQRFGTREKQVSRMHWYVQLVRETKYRIPNRTIKLTNDWLKKTNISWIQIPINQHWAGQRNLWKAFRGFVVLPFWMAFCFRFQWSVPWLPISFCQRMAFVEITAFAFEPESA